MILLLAHIAVAQGNAVANFSDTQLMQNGANDQDYINSKIDPKPFDRETWNKKRDGLNYNDKKVEQEQAKQKNANDYKKSADADEYREKPESSPPSANWNFNLGNTGQVLLILTVILLLAFLVFAIVKTGLLTSNTKITQTQQDAQLLENLEDNIHESDLERALRLALEANDYRLAIRVYYLTILKELSLQEQIHWKRDKTNGQYVIEMREKPEGSAFWALTLSFERAWYSDEVIVQKHYDALNPEFQSFINSLKKR